MAKRKTFTVPLAKDLSEGFLQLPVTLGGESISLGDRIEVLLSIQEAANKMLQESSLAGFVANQVMRDMNKRGSASLIMSSEGVLHLQVSYDEPRSKVASPVVRQSRSSDLPTMAELRKKAARVSVDISHLGRQRRAIHELLQQHDGSDLLNIPARPLIPAERGESLANIKEAEDIDSLLESLS